MDIESDDDLEKCHKWSRTQTAHPYEIQQAEYLEEYGRPCKIYDASILPHELVEEVLTDEFVNNIIQFTNEHGDNDEMYRKTINLQ